MRSGKTEKFFPWALGAIVALGSFWSFTRGGNDFLVFYEAWRLVLAGKAELIYRVSPDRFLYAPAFALLLAPLAWIPKSYCLGFWCLLKGWSVGLCVRSASRFFGLSAGWVSLGFLLAAKPLLIDFQYGQVNTFILCLTIIAMMVRMRGDAPVAVHGAIWVFAALAGFSKLYTLPLLAVPFFYGDFLSPEKRRAERISVLATLAVLIALPFFTGWGTELYRDWFYALQLRGAPIESHNQSFWAFLRHIFGSEPTPVLAQGLRGYHFGLGWLDEFALEQLGKVWLCFSLAALGGWILTLRGRDPRVGVAVAVSLCILPSHLVWKPYFVFTIPLLILLVHLHRQMRVSVWSLLAAGALINLTGFDFLGADLGAFVESACLLLWVHLGLLALVLFKSRQLLPSRALGST